MNISCIKHQISFKLIPALLAAVVFAVSSADAYAAQVSGPGYEELRGVWISYIDWNEMPSDEDGFKDAVNGMLDRCVGFGINSVFVHVRPDCDAMYPSEYFPWSRFVTGTQGADPGYDPLEYFIEAAHERGLKFHAWINPYRVTGNANSWAQVADSNPVKVWLSDGDPSNDRWVLYHDGAYYLNPSVPEVRKLIVNGVDEIVKNYDVDGIHFDDYFYPILDNSDPARWFDLPEYEASGSSEDISAWRRDNVNTLIRDVYSTVKEADPNLLFGISPEGYVDHLRMDDRLFTDIDTWCSESGYIDYIMPQIYWGFETRTSDGNIAPYAFDNNLSTWIDLTRGGPVDLYLGLAMYKTGRNTSDGNEVSEWIRYDDIIAREVEAARRTGSVSGYCFYAYSSFLEDESAAEVANLMKVLDDKKFAKEVKSLSLLTQSPLSVRLAGYEDRRIFRAVRRQP